MVWIDVKEKLPPSFGLYLTFDSNHKFKGRFYGVKIMRYYPKKKLFWWFNENNDHKVTHWMKIPEVRALIEPG